MVSTFQRLDTDESTVLLDLNTLAAGSATGFGLLSNPDFGSVQTESDWLVQYPYPGASQGSTHRPVRRLRVPLRCKGASTDDLISKLRSLAQYLESPGVWKWQMDGAGTAVYFDSYQSPVPSLLGGEDLALFRAAQLNDVDWVLVELDVNPIPRAAKLANQANGTVTNQASSRYIKVTNPGNTRSIAVVRVAPANNSDSVNLAQVRIGRRSFGNLTEFSGNFVAFEVEGATLGTDTTNVSDAAGSGGHIARTAFSDTVLRQRWRKVLTPSDKTALQGTFRILVTARVNTGCTYVVQLRWNLFDASPAPAAQQVNQSFTVDTTNMASNYFVELDLGLVSFPPSGSSLVLEGWASCDTGSKNLDWDVCQLLPADEPGGLIRAPNAVPPIIGAETWESIDASKNLLFTTPANCNATSNPTDSVIIDAQYDGVGVQPAGGSTLPAGRHVVSTHAHARYNNQTVATLGVLRVRYGAATVNNWTNGHVYSVGDIVKPTTVHGRTFKCTTGGTSGGGEPSWNYADGATTNDNTVVWTETTIVSTNIKSGAGVTVLVDDYEVAFDAVAATLYEFVVVGTNASLARNVMHLKIDTISHTFEPVVSNPDRFVMDGKRSFGYLDDGSGNVKSIAQVGYFVELVPGDQYLCVAYAQAPQQGMRAALNSVAPILQQNPLCSCTVQVDVYPGELPQ